MPGEKAKEGEDEAKALGGGSGDKQVNITAGRWNKTGPNPLCSEANPRGDIVGV